VKSQQSLKLQILDYVFYVFLNAASKKREERILELCLTALCILYCIPYVLYSYLDSLVDAFHHDETDIGVSVAESPRTKLLLFFFDGLTHEYVRIALAIDEFDEVERVSLCRQRVSQRPTTILLFLEHLQYETVELSRVYLVIVVVHRTITRTHIKNISSLRTNSPIPMHPHSTPSLAVTPFEFRYAFDIFKN